MKYILLATGGALGTILRFLIASSVDNRNLSDFPWGTFLVNATGSFIIGLLAGLFLKQNVSIELRIFLFAGLLGGFTTFSSLALEGMNLIKNGNTYLAFTYLISTNLAGVLLAGIGFFAGIKLSNI